MDETIEARVGPEVVWEAWEAAHEKHGQGKIAVGQSGKAPFRYKVLKVDPGKSFSILWKALFVRIVFQQSVKRSARGSEICYGVQIRGLFAWPVQWLLGGKIRRNIRAVLGAVVKQLEEQRKK